MNSPILHYVYDPLCGWCYAAEPMVRAAGEAGISIVLHGGGLWDPGVHATDAKRRMMRETDGRISELTGQPFGAAYLDGLLVDPASIWWSRRRRRGPDPTWRWSRPSSTPIMSRVDP